MKSKALLAAAVLLAGTPLAIAQTDLQTPNRAWSGSTGTVGGAGATGSAGSYPTQYSPTQYYPVERAAPRPQSQREADLMQPNKTLFDREGDEIGPSPEVDRQTWMTPAQGTGGWGAVSQGSAGSSAVDPATTGSGSAGYGSAGSGMSGSGSTGVAPTDRTNNRGYSGSTTGSVSGQGQTVTGSVTQSDIQNRRGRGQNDLELRQTSLLNVFSGAGYISVRDFRKEGDRYVAQAQDRSGRWASVEMDPRTGTITPR